MSRIETVFTGDTRNIDRQLLQLNSKIDKYAANAAKASDRAAKGSAQAWRNGASDINGSLNGIGATLSRIGGLFAAAFSAREAIAMADTFTTFETKLINAKVAAEDMARVQGELFAIAKANGGEIVALADLYGNLSMSAKDLGLSQSEIMQATAGVSAAMRISGATTAQASATILQLGQALAGGTVRAEEYNSMLENSPALVRAIAASSDQWGGSLGALRTAINDGKVSSQEWGQAIVEVSAKLQSDAAAAPLTVAANFQNLQTSLIQYIGQADKTLGASEKLGFALQMLGDNIGTVIEFIAAGAAIMAGRYAASIAVATASNLRYQATLFTMAAAQTNVTRTSLLATTAMRGLSGALALAGGPWGIAFMAIAAAIYFVAKRASEGTAAQQALAAQTARTSTAFDKYKEAAIAAANASGAAKAKALEHANTLRAEMNQALQTSQALLVLARSRRVAAAQEARATYQRLVDQGATAGSHTSEPQRAAAIVAGNRLRAAEREEFQAGYDYAKAANDLRSFETELRNGDHTNAVTVPSGGGGSGGGGSSGRSAPTAAEVASNDADLERETSRRLADAQAALAGTVEARHANALQHLDWEAEDAKRAVQKQLADKEITDTTARTAVDNVNAALADRRALAEKEHQADLAAEATRLAMEAMDAEQAVARIQQDTLLNRADLAETLAERLTLERQAFDLYQTSERAAFDARQEETRARLRLAGQLDAEAERRLTAEAEAFAARQSSEADVQASKERDSNPFSKYVDAAKDINQRFKEIAADGLGEFEDGIVSAIMRTEKLGDAFRNVAKQIMADLARLAVQKFVTAPLANALGFGNGGGAGGLFTSLLGGAKKRAIGDRSTTGGLYRINEGGAEGIVLPRGSEIIPAGKMRGLATPKVSGGTTQVFNLTTNVQAAGAVMAAEFRQEIGQANVMAVQQARQMSSQDMMRANKKRLR